MNRINYSKLCRLGYFTPDSDWKKIGTVKGMQVWAMTEEGSMIDIDVVTNTMVRGKMKLRRIMTMSISNTYFKKAYHVDITQIDSEFQGMGIAPIVYKYIMKKMGITLQAGSCQSPGGRYIWNQLADMDDVLVYGKVGRKGQAVCLSAGEDGELESHVPWHSVYDGSKDYHVFACYSPQ